jgi:hypothetical protein
MLNWLCVVEKRIERNIPQVESLWLIRARQFAPAGPQAPVAVRIGSTVNRSSEN